MLNVVSSGVFGMLGSKIWGAGCGVEHGVRVIFCVNCGMCIVGCKM